MINNSKKESRQRSKSIDEKHLKKLMEAPNFDLNDTKVVKNSQKLFKIPKSWHKQFSLKNSVEQDQEPRSYQVLESKNGSNKSSHQKNHHFMENIPPMLDHTHWIYHHKNDSKETQKLVEKDGREIVHVYDLESEENKNQDQNNKTRASEHKSTKSELIKKQDSKNNSHLHTQIRKFKQEEPHYMKSIPGIFEHQHEQLHHNYKEGAQNQN